MIGSNELLDLKASGQNLLAQIEDAQEAKELIDLIEQLDESIASENSTAIEAAKTELADFIYYTKSNSETDS